MVKVTGSITDECTLCVRRLRRARGDINIHAHTHNITRAYAHSGAGNELSSIHHAAARALKSLFDMRVQIVSLIGFHEEKFTTTLPFIYFYGERILWNTAPHLGLYIPNAPRAATNKDRNFKHKERRVLCSADWFGAAATKVKINTRIR